MTAKASFQMRSGHEEIPKTQDQGYIRTVLLRSKTPRCHPATCQVQVYQLQERLQIYRSISQQLVSNSHSVRAYIVPGLGARTRGFGHVEGVGLKVPSDIDEVYQVQDSDQKLLDGSMKLRSCLTEDTFVEVERNGSCHT
jgi:hypothetical protein